VASETYDVMVVGGGIIGAACALALRRDGSSVLLVDRGEPERAASWGNAGHFAYEQIFPLATPALWAQLPQLFFSRQSPLRIPPRNFRSLAPWLARFAWNTRGSQFRRATGALAQLLAAAPEAWRRLAELAGLQALIKSSPVLVVALDAAALAAKRSVMGALRQQGIDNEELGPEAARAVEPMLRSDVAGAFVYPRAHFCVDPAALAAGVRDAYRAAGGAVVDDRIGAIQTTADGVVGAGSARSWTARQCVLAAGIGSRELLRGLSVRVPLAAERGYHLMIPYLEGAPRVRVPIIGAQPQFVITPMAKGLRLAGTVELALDDAHPDWRRATMMKEFAERIIGPLDAAGATKWMGCRPSLPDSLPVIGRIPAAPSIVGAFGHQHLGLTLSAITAELVAAIVRNRPPPLDIAPYAISRF
jgi:glycine/D-amino acid oxidase-like deaminating enzyme